MTCVPPARHLLRARDLADARYFEKLSVADLAGAAGLSRGHFSEQLPEERPHGIDSSFRDPSGNHIRLLEAR